jgi:group I intron endonuclease
MSKANQNILPACAGVYEITFLDTGEFYVGGARNIRKRWSGHLHCLELGSHQNKTMQQRYDAGYRSFCVRVLEFVDEPTTPAIREAEQRHLDASGVGISAMCLNVLAVAGSHLGAKRSDETRRRLSQAKIGNNPSQETREKMRAAKLGKKQPREMVEKRAAAIRGRPCNRPHGIINHNLRKWSPDEIRGFRAMRSNGASWKSIAMAANTSNEAAIRRAVLGITYKDVI